MNIAREGLILNEVNSTRYKFEFDMMDDVTPSAVGIIDIDDPIDFYEIKIWDSEGYQNITDTELGLQFKIELMEFLIYTIL